MQAWLVLLTSISFYFYQAIIKVSSSGLEVDLAHEFLVSAHRLGNLSAAFYLSYTLIQIPAGATLDRFGVRRVLPWMVLVCGLGCILFSLAPYYAVASISRLIIGFAAAFAFLGCLKLVNNWFSHDRLSMLTGVVSSIGSIGAILGEEPFSALVDQIGWRYSMFLLGLLGLILTPLLLGVLKDTPSGHSHILKKSLKDYKDELKEILRDKQLWHITIYGSLVSMPISTLPSLWGVPFIMARYQVNNKMAATAISFIFLGWVMGGAFWGWVSDTLKRRLPFLYIAAIAPAFFLFIIIYYPFKNFSTPCALLFGFGFFSSAYLTSFAMVCEISKPAQVGTVLGFVNMINTLFVTFSLPFLGRILDFFWSGKMQGGVRVYQLADYQISMTCVVGFIAISLFFAFFIKETHGKHVPLK